VGEGEPKVGTSVPGKNPGWDFNELKVLTCSELEAASVLAVRCGPGTGHRRLPPKLRGPAMLHRHAPRGANSRNSLVH